MTADHPYRYAIDPMGNSTANKVLTAVGYSRRVLELGCGPGVLSRAMQANDCLVTAIERDAELAAEAQPYCERLIIADLDQPACFDALDDEPFDVVLAADVLEHLRDPGDCLRRVRERLRPDGRLVVSLPNVTYAGVVAEMLSGRFRYREKGLLDRTHLRFFGREDVERLLYGAGFLPLSWQYHQVAVEDSEFSDVWYPLPDALRQSVRAGKDAEVYQFIVSAMPLIGQPWLNSVPMEIAELWADRERLLREREDWYAEREEYQNRLETAAGHEAHVFDLQDRLQLMELERDAYARAFEEGRLAVQDLERERDALELRLQDALRTWRMRFLNRLRRLLPGRSAGAS